MTRMLYRLSAKRVPVENIRAKAEEYVTEGHLRRIDADALLRHIEAERGLGREGDDSGTADVCRPGAEGATGDEAIDVHRLRLADSVAAICP